MKYVLISHGDFASGALNASQMIVGELEEVIALGMKDDVHLFEEELDKTLSGEEAVIFADIVGGHPFNTAYKIGFENKANKQVIVAGFNMPLLIEASLKMNVQSIEEITEWLEAQNCDSIKVVKNW